VNERRRKLVPVSAIFAQMIGPATDTVTHTKCTEGLPADATFIGLTYDHMRDAYYFCYQSAEWDEVPLGEMLPTFAPRFMKFNVAPFLEQAEKLIAAQYGAEANKWLEEYRAFKKQR
jgi:hypothetical protein